MSPVKRATKQFFFLFLMVLFISVITTDNHQVVSLCFAAYGLGSIPFGYILSRIVGKDLSKIGSGNIGATNVLRTGKKGLAALTLLLDALKGWLAVFWLGSFSGPEYLPYIIALSALIGHLYPFWLDFKGGKGVATGAGVLLALSWPLGLASVLLWLLFAFWFRFSSLAALLSVASIPVLSLMFVNKEMALFSFIMGCLIFIRHKDNIQRLILGMEPKIGKR
jgi:acyl phosphate:glycerol-3-phosphate acyltransferase